MTYAAPEGYVFETCQVYCKGQVSLIFDCKVDILLDIEIHILNKIIKVNSIYYKLK